MRVVIAEDDVSTRELLAHLLRARGYEVHTVSTGMELLSALAEQPFDLVITDVAMPGMLGTQVLATVRAAGLGTPFLVVTAYGERQLRAADVLDKGERVAVLRKPFRIGELQDGIAALIAA